MMALIFGTMLAALMLGWQGYRRLAVACAAVSLALSLSLFLFEIYSPEYGFRMPWIQTAIDPSPGQG